MTAGGLVGFAKSPPKTKETIIKLNDKMCPDIQTSLTHREFYKADADNIIQWTRFENNFRGGVEACPGVTECAPFESRNTQLCPQSAAHQGQDSVIESKLLQISLKA